MEKAINTIAERLASWSYQKEDEQKEIIQYGYVLLIENLYKVLFLLLIGAVCRHFIETVFAILAFSGIRLSAGGRHRKTSFGCFLSMLLVCVCACVASEIIIPQWIYCIIAILIITGILLKAPAFLNDAYDRSRKNMIKRKIIALIYYIALSAIVLCLFDYSLQNAVLIASFLEMISLWGGEELCRKKV